MDRIYSLDQIGEIAAAMLKQFGTKTVWAFHAPMGAGKTTLIAAIGKEMGIQEAITSPTFALMNQYDAQGSPTCMCPSCTNTYISFSISIGIHHKWQGR